MEATRSTRHSGRKIALAGLLTGAEIGVSPRRARRDRCGTTVGVTTDDGVRLAADVDECPSPEYAVVFAHGWVLNRQAWRFQRRALAGTATLVFYDQRGHGGSAPGPDGSLTVDRLGDDLAAVVERTVPDGVPVVVAGHAMGSVAIMSLAARRPELFGSRIVGSVLLSPSCGRLAYEALVPARWRTVAGPPDSGESGARIAPVIPLHLDRGPDRGLDRGDVAHEGAGRYGRGAWRGRASAPGSCSIPETHVGTTAARPGARGVGGDPRCGASKARAKRDHLRFVYERVEATPTETMTGHLHDLLVREDPALLSALRRAQTMIMVGSGDRLTPPMHSRRIADLLPEAVLTVVAGAGHLLALERPDVVNRALRGFLLDCRDRARQR
ncbi:alpha/beta hydrolase [Thermopolyspora sp. NPDC052614]|uniref:alpha/beta fold hydrolase n=1 Tax=Thermopolyspora sp. NPDC052614 TaxID=3155682 RepID=UPI0034369514